MEKQKINVRMLGTLELEYNGKILNEADNRSQKLWMLLAYIVFYHKKSVSQKEVLEALWNQDEGANVLKTTLHRLRKMLAEVFGEEFAHSFIGCHNKNYFIGEEYEIICDAEAFELGVKLAKEERTEKEKLSRFWEMFELYRGDFLSNFSEEGWVIPLSIFYRSIYLELVQNVLNICERQKLYKEAVGFLGRAGELMKYEESIYVPLIRILIRMENYSDAVQVYERLNDMLEVTYGVKPSKEAKNLYQEAIQALNIRKLDMPGLMSSLEQEGEKKALFCDFDMFKLVYHSYIRGAERNHTEICLGLIDITDLQDGLLSKRSLSTCVTNLKELICNNLRSGDIVTMCTPSQFSLILQHTTEETAMIAMERIKTTFYKQYPHTPAKLTCHVRSIVKNS